MTGAEISGVKKSIRLQRRPLTIRASFPPTPDHRHQLGRHHAVAAEAVILHNYFKEKVVGRLGFEPRTIRLKVECSTTELPARIDAAGGRWKRRGT